MKPNGSYHTWLIIKFFSRLSSQLFNNQVYNHLGLKFQNLITYLDDPIIIQGYQSLSSNQNLIKTRKKIKILSSKTL
jgi:hypothetical protein